MNDFIPGYLQGLSRVIVSHPFDYIRLYLQTNESKSIKHFLKNNNFKTLYRGVGIPLFSVPIDRAIQFKCYEYLNKEFNPFISGSLCGIVSSLFTLPTSYICNNYILNKNKNDIIKFIKEISNINEFKKIYNGFKPEIMRSVVGTSIYLGVYGNMRDKFGNSIYQSILNSSIAGISVWTITYPLETLKVEQQFRNKSLKDIYKYRIKKYGFLNLWKGILPVYIRTIPSSIIGMVVYEESKKFLLK